MRNLLSASILASLVALAAPASAQHGGAEAVEPAGGVAAEPGHGGHHDPSLHFNFWPDLSDPLGYRKKDAAGGPLGDNKFGAEPLAPGQAEEPMSAPFSLLVLNFGIVLFILWKFGGPAARKMAEARSDQIKDALEEAAKLRNQAASKLDEYNRKLKAAESEITQLVEGMRRDAEADRVRIVADAEAQAKMLERDAEVRIAAEIQRARVNLQREVAKVAAETAERLIRERLTDADQSQLAETFIKDLGAAANQSPEVRS